ncbi:MAG: hypothetical protein L0H36_00290 [bacterium]|nr:hypothetical protein [bacterium]MDN5835056.1 hypothetical protein [bacterium]
MKIGTPYEITIEPVDMSGHYTLMFIVCGVLLIGGIVLAIVSYIKTDDTESAGTIIGVVSAGVGLLGLLFWGYAGLSSAYYSTVNDRIEQQLEQSVGLHSIIATNGSHVSSGFIAVTNDGQSVRGVVEETGHDRYDVILYEYK